MSQSLPIHQEVLLLSLGDGDGHFTAGNIEYALAGAIISDLCLLGNIEITDDKAKKVRVISQADPANDQLAAALGMIKESTKLQSVQTWVTKIAQTSGLRHKVAQSLCEMGILEETDTKVLFLFTRKTYPELDGTWEDSIRRRLADVMFHPEVKADVRTAVLIAFTYHCHLLQQNFAPVELKQHQKRIKELATNPSHDLVSAEATKAAIQAVQAAVMAAVIIPSVVAATSVSSN